MLHVLRGPEPGSPSRGQTDMLCVGKLVLVLGVYLKGFFLPRD